MPISHDKLVDAWIKQSELLWRTTYATPAIATAIFAGWYVASRDGNIGVARSVLLVGFLVMIVQWMIVHRMACYLNKFRDAVGDGLPRVEKHQVVSFSGISFVLPLGHSLAKSIPLILALLFFVMFILTF